MFAETERNQTRRASTSRESLHVIATRFRNFDSDVELARTPPIQYVRVPILVISAVAARLVSRLAFAASRMAAALIGKGILLKGDAVAGTFKDEIQSAVSCAARAPKLVGILGTSAAPSRFYADFTKKQCDALGVEYVLKETGKAADPALEEGEGVEEAIIEANEDESVDGIMVSCRIARGRWDVDTTFRSTTQSLESNKCVPRSDSVNHAEFELE